MNRIAHSLLLGAIIAAAWGPRNALAADVVGARMTCSDPSGSFIANLDSATFQKMALVTQAMAAAPSGLSCNLEQIPPSPGHGSKNFAVGGGQFLDSCGGAPFPVNFAFSAHSDADESNVNGTVDLTFPANQSCFPESHETGMVQCLTVVANNANFSGPITHATGAFSNKRFFEGMPRT